jgi:hypothetical protein
MKKKNRLFRDELPGEKKSIINLLMTGYIVSISCMGYAAFYIFIQLGQIDRISSTITSSHTEEQISVLKDRMNRTTHQLRNEMIGIAILGTLISIIGMGYTINMVISPLRKLVDYAEKKGKIDLPEFKSNHEIKQLATQLADLLGDSSTEQNTEKARTEK